MNTLYTYGYGAKLPHNLVQQVMRLKAHIADIRYSPRSNMFVWDLASLEFYFAQYYPEGRVVWLQELGNKTYKQKGVITLNDTERGLNRLRTGLKQNPIIILCGCQDLRACHRLSVANLMVQRYETKVVHL